MSKAYLYAHHQLLDEFKNATHWPKHLLVQYSWEAEQEVDALSGLYVVFAVCEPCRPPPPLLAPYALATAPIDVVHLAGGRRLIARSQLLQSVTVVSPIVALLQIIK